MFYVILMIFHFSFSFVNCGNATASDVVAVEIPTTSTELMTQIITETEIIAATVETPTTSIESSTEQIGKTVPKIKRKHSRHARFISLLRGAFDNMRFLVKSLVQSYNWYTPELELGKCVMEYTKMLYPELMQKRLSYESVMKYVRSIYFAIYRYVTEMINENRRDTQYEQQRIGNKVAEMTLRDTVSPIAATSSSMSSSWPLNHVKSTFSNFEGGNFNYVQKFSPFSPYNDYHEKNHLKSNVSIIQSYENELKEEQSFNDFLPRTRRMDVFKFDKNNFLTNPINEKECQEANSSFLAVKEKFETQHSNNYNMPTADYSSSSFTPTSSSSVSQSTTTSATNNFHRHEITENKIFSQELDGLEDNLNIKESLKADKKQNKFSVMYIGPRHLSTDYQDMSSSSDDKPTLELNKNSNDEKGASNTKSNFINPNQFYSSHSSNATASTTNNVRSNGSVSNGEDGDTDGSGISSIYDPEHNDLIGTNSVLNGHSNVKQSYQLGDYRRRATACSQPLISSYFINDSTKSKPDFSIYGELFGKKLRLYYQNVRGLRTKTAVTFTATFSCECDVTETSLHSSILDSELFSAKFSVYTEQYS